jgi:hypothetical protein
MTDAAALVRSAFYDAQSRRPYKADSDLVTAAIPPGGDWLVVAEPGAVCRSVMWGGIEVAHVNPRGQLDDVTEGYIAMAVRAVPLLDAALRSIIVLAESADMAPLIRDLAVAAVAFIEMPAPPIHKDGGPDDGEEPEDWS